jgi:hypothetical protein
MNYQQQWLQYGRNIFWNVFHKIEAKIPPNIPKFTIPIVFGIPVLYYSLKKIYSRITIIDNYQENLNQKNNTTQSVIDIIAFFDKNSINTINYEIMCNRLIKFNINYNKLSINKITDIFLFKTKKDFLDCKQYYYKIWLDIENQRFYGKLNHDIIGGSNICKFLYIAFANEQKDNFYYSRFYHIFSAIKLILLRNKIPKIKNPFPLFENSINIQRYLLKESFDRKNNVKASIIYKIMLRLYYCLNIKSQGRDLVCILPITFYNTKNINNNIGIMWMTFNEADTVESIKRKIEKNTYQIFGTNFILSNRFFSTKISSKITQKNADAIITILFTEDNSLISQGEIKNCNHNNFVKQNYKDNSLISQGEIKNCNHNNFVKQNYKDMNNIQISWTYPKISNYPVYVAVHSRLSENTVHLTQTYTVNTPNFKPGELQQVQNNYLFDNS